MAYLWLIKKSHAFQRERERERESRIELRMGKSIKIID